MSIQIIGVQKTTHGDLLQFTLIMKDLENTSPGYVWHSETGSEEALRSAMAKAGMPARDIDAWFANAKGH
jgi:hypothetical protein